MSAITYAMQQIINHRLVDVNGLRTAYMGKGCTPLSTLDNEILFQTLYGRVVGDIDILGGIEKNLCSDHATQIDIQDNGIVYHYNNEVMHDHKLISVLSYWPGISCRTSKASGCVCMGSVASSPTSITNNNAMSSLASDIAGSVVQSGPNVITTARVVSHNSILVEDCLNHQPGTFKTMWSYDDVLNDVPPKAWPYFGKLAIAAVKSYVHHTLLENIDKKQIYMGQTLEVTTAIIDKYADAEQEYQDLLAGWGRIGRYIDKKRHRMLIKMQGRKF